MLFVCKELTLDIFLVSNILTQLINICLLLLVVLLPASSLSLYFNIHPAVIIIFLLFLLVIIRDHKAIFSGVFWKENKKIAPLIFLFFLLFLQSLLSLIFAPKMPPSAYDFGVGGFESPNLIRYYGIFTLLKSLLLGGLMAVIIKKDDFLKIINLHILTSVIFSLFGIINFLTYCVFQVSSFDFGIMGGRVKSISVEPQAFASYLLTVIPFLIFGLCAKKTMFFKKGLLWAFLIIDLFAFILTFSTGGLIAFLAIIVCFYLLLTVKNFRQYISFKNIKIFTVFLLLLFVFALTIGKEEMTLMLQKFGTKESPSFSGRWDSWQAGIEMIKSRPLFGVGPESYGYFFKEYSDAPVPQPTIGGPGAPAVILPLPQNLLIGTAANIGILGAVFFLLIFLYPVIKLWQQIKSKEHTNNSVPIIAVSLLLVLVGLLVQNLAFWTPYAFFLWFFIGLAGAFINSYS